MIWLRSSTQRRTACDFTILGITIKQRLNILERGLRWIWMRTFLSERVRTASKHIFTEGSHFISALPRCFCEEMICRMPCSKYNIAWVISKTDNNQLMILEVFAVAPRVGRVDWNKLIFGKGGVEMCRAPRGLKYILEEPMGVGKMSPPRMSRNNLGWAGWNSVEWSCQQSLAQEKRLYVSVEIRGASPGRLCSIKTKYPVNTNLFISGHFAHLDRSQNMVFLKQRANEAPTANEL